jgi:hypothetical protein
MAGSGSSAISQARIEVLDETGARETKSRGVLNERALGIGRLIFGWHLPFHVAQIRDARAFSRTRLQPQRPGDCLQGRVKQVDVRGPMNFRISHIAQGLDGLRGEQTSPSARRRDSLRRE